MRCYLLLAPCRRTKLLVFACTACSAGPGAWPACSSGAGDTRSGDLWWREGPKAKPRLTSSLPGIVSKKMGGAESPSGSTKYSSF